MFQNTNIIYTLEEISNQSLQFGDNELIQEIFEPDDMGPQTDEEFALRSSLNYLAISPHPYQHHQHLHQQAIQIAALKKSFVPIQLMTNMQTPLIILQSQ